MQRVEDRVFGTTVDLAQRASPRTTSTFSLAHDGITYAQIYDKIKAGRVKLALQAAGFGASTLPTLIPPNPRPSQHIPL